MAHRRINRCFGAVFQLGQRAAHVGFAHAQIGQRIFGAGHSRFGKDRFMQRHELVRDVQRGGVITCQRGGLKVSTVARGDVGGDRDTALTALRVKPMRCGVFAR